MKIRLEVGYLYKNRKGEKIHITDDNIFSYKYDGKYKIDETENDQDLIEEIGVYEENNGPFDEDIEVYSDNNKLSQFKKERKLIASAVMKMFVDGIFTSNSIVKDILDNSYKITDKLLEIRNIK